MRKSSLKTMNLKRNFKKIRKNPVCVTGFFYAILLTFLKLIIC